MRTRLVELQTTLNVGMDHRDNVLTSIGYNLDHWIVMVNLHILAPSPSCLFHLERSFRYVVQFHQATIFVFVKQIGRISCTN